MSMKRSFTMGTSATTRGVMTIVALFVAIALILTGMIYIEGRLFDGVRAYVRGEGLWAKAQKDAVIYLERYSYEHDEADFLAFQRATLVSLGDKDARLALLQSTPDLVHAAAGFRQGRNDVQDVDSMIWFFLNFQGISYMRDAIEIWKEGDLKIEELIRVSEEIRREIASGQSEPEKLMASRAHVSVLNDELLELENSFSEVLGEGARWVKSTVWQLSLMLLIVFMVIGIAVSRRIIRAITKAERDLLISESRFSSLKASNTIGIASWHMDGSLVEVNDLFLNMLGYSRDDASERRLNWRELTPHEFLADDERALRELENFGRCNPYEKSLIHKDGHHIYFGASLLQGDREQGIAFVVDMTERKKGEEQQLLARMVFEHIDEAIIVTDAYNRIIATNPAFTAMIGYSLDEVRGRDPKMMNSGKQDDEFYKGMWEAINNHGSWQGEIWNRRKDGELCVLSLTINTIFNPDRSVHRRVALYSDISGKKEAEEVIRRQANYDPLTGLPNRRMLNDRLGQQLKKSRRDGLLLALLFIDLDRFKEVNDTLGHEMGDVLLKQAAERMLACVRESDSVGRLGGDEFVIVLGDMGEFESVQRIVDELLGELARPFMLGGEEVSVSASIGITFYPEDAQDITTLLRNADHAMYEAKRKGRNCYHYYAPRGDEGMRVS